MAEVRIALVWAIPILLLMAGCSLSGNLFLYNSLTVPISVAVPVEGATHEWAHISPNSVGKIIVNFSSSTVLAVRKDDGVLCFNLPAIPGEFIKARMGRGHVLAKITDQGSLYIYSPSMQEHSFFNVRPPVQPPGLPVTLESCTLTSS